MKIVYGKSAAVVVVATVDQHDYDTHGVQQLARSDAAASENAPLHSLFLNLDDADASTKRSGRKDSTQITHDYRQSRRDGTAGDGNCLLL